MRLIVKGAFWLGLYAFIVVLPLVVGAVFISSADSAGFGVALADALGYLGLALMAFELALVTRTKGAASAFGEDALLQFHRQIGIAAFLLVLTHPVLLIVSRAYPAAILWPGGGMAWPVWIGSVAFVCVLLVVGFSLLRKRLRTPYELWQATHGLLAMALVATAVVHIVAVGRFAAMPIMQALWALYLVVFIGLFLRYRLFKPLRLWGRPWEVVENRAEQGNARTVVMKPTHHKGFSAEPGQFAWVGFGRTPFAMTQHPICISSANDADQPSDEVSFTIKALGDWSGKVVPEVKPGARAWVDGPHGVFTIDREEGAGYGLIGGGVGITPLRSMVLALEERGDVRPVVLFYGVNSEADLTYDEELAELDRRMENLTVVRVLSKSGDDWTGERGYIDADILKRYLPERLLTRFQYFICGPNALMDAMEKALPQIGVPRDHVHTERFDMV
jgi:predicted ferric reductase